MRIFFRLVMIFLSAAPAAAETWFIPAAANTSGAHGTNWRTEAVLVNPGSALVRANLFFLEADRDNGAAEAHPLNVPAAHSVTIDDLVGTFFAAPGKAGAVRVEADGPLVVTSRTFNDLGDAGTYGQGIPALTPGSALRQGETRTVYPLMLTEGFRTNVGLVNGSPVPIHVKASLYNAGAAFYPWPFGTMEWDLAPYEYVQQNNILEPYYWGPMIERAYAVFSVDTPVGMVFPWASIVDNRTGDPVFTPSAETAMLAVAPEREWVRVSGWGGDDLAHAVAFTDDGGMWVAGESDSTEGHQGDGWVLKVDAWGRLLGSRSLFSLGQDKIFGLHALPGGGAVLCGGATDPDSARWNAWALALTGTGQVLWSRVFAQPESAWLYGILPMPDGTFRACGQILPEDGSPADAWILSLDGNGAILWQKRLSGPREDWLYTLAPAEDGGFVAAGATRSFDGSDWDAWLVRLDGDGNVPWEKIYGGHGGEAAYGIVALASGGFALSGQTDSWGAGGGDLWLFRTDAEGDFVWGRTLGTKDWDTAYAMACSTDGRILTVGQKGAITAGEGDAWVVEWDGDGNVLSQALFGGAEPERLYGASARPDGGWLTAGRTQSEGAGGKDLLLISLPEGLAISDPCSFATASAFSPLPVPAEWKEVGSSRFDTAAGAGPWFSPSETLGSMEDRIRCGSTFPGPFRFLVPAAARTFGSHGTRWKTDLFLRLPYGRWVSDETAKVTFLRSGQDNPDPPAVTMNGFPGELVKVADVLETLFGETEASGALRIEADGPVDAWTVTYDQSEDGGTHGQSIPAFAEEDCQRNGETAMLAGLVRTPEYRTNVGFAGPGPAGAEITVDVHASDGSLLGSRTCILSASGHFQAGDFLRDFGERVEGAYAIVHSSTADACFFAYASVVDNRTGDPVYIPAAMGP